MGVRFEVTTAPKFSVEELAIQLADALQSSSDAQNDVTTYNEQIIVERRKISDLEILSVKVQSFRDNMPEKVSRMEPMMQYDLVAMGEEAATSKASIEDWEKMIEVANHKHKRNQKESIRLQKELRKQKK